MHLIIEVSKMLPQSIHLNLAITKKELEIGKQKNLVQKLKELKKP